MLKVGQKVRFKKDYEEFEGTIEFIEEEHYLIYSEQMAKNHLGHSGSGGLSGNEDSVNREGKNNRYGWWWVLTECDTTKVIKNTPIGKIKVVGM